MRQAKRNRMFGVAVAAAIVSTTATASAGAASLVGAGSTLVAPLMAKWTADFGSQTGNQVTYGAVGSGAGIAQITARTVDFGASDAPFRPSQAAACGGCVQIPWALSATGIAFRLDGVSTLKLSGPILAQMYLGQITNWSDPRLKALNKGIALPNLKITPAFRSDGSGDTYAFTNWLTDVSSAWKGQVGVSTAVSFPTGVGGKGNDGISAVVGSTNGSLGYIAASYIIAHGLNAAALQNAAGRFVYPNLHNIEAAAQLVKHVPASNELHIVNPSKRSKAAYPLSTFTYVLVPKASRQKDLLVSFIRYALGTRAQSFGGPLDFAPIPKVVLNAASSTLAQLQQG